MLSLPKRFSKVSSTDKEVEDGEDDLEPNAAAAFPYNFYGTSFGRQYHGFFSSRLCKSFAAVGGAEARQRGGSR